MSSIGFVFTNWNNAEVTKQAVASIESNSRSSEIIIVDNGSSANCINELRQIENNYPNVRLVLSEQNIGYFNGINKGLEYLKWSGRVCQFIVIGNNDLVFLPSFFECLTEKTEMLLTYPVISPNIVTLDGQHQNPHVAKGISRRREVLYDLYFSSFLMANLMRQVANVTRRWSQRGDEKEFSVPQLICQGYGACYVLGPKFFDYWERLWAPTFILGEEFFLSKQLAEKGYQVYYEPELLVQHQCHASVSKLTSRKVWELGRAAHRIYRSYVRVW